MRHYKPMRVERLRKITAVFYSMSIQSFTKTSSEYDDATSEGVDFDYQDSSPFQYLTLRLFLIPASLDVTFYHAVLVIAHFDPNTALTDVWKCAHIEIHGLLPILVKVSFRWRLRESVFESDIGDAGL